MLKKHTKTQNLLITPQCGREIEKSKIRDLINSEDPFPVDFDEAWQWCGYFKKQDAKRKLVRNFTKDTDYQLLTRMREQKNQGGNNKEVIILSVDAFKAFAMMAGTAKGKEVRKYFIDCEKELHQLKMLLLEEKDKQIKQIEASTKEKETKLLNSEKEIKTLKNKFRFINANYFSVLHFCKLNGIALSDILITTYNKRCTELSKQFGKPIYSYIHKEFKQVMVYHLDILRAAIK